MRNDGWFGDLIKIIWWDGQGACLFSKRLEQGRFVWPSPADGKVSVTPAQLAMLLEGIEMTLRVRFARAGAATHLAALDDGLG